MRVNERNIDDLIDDWHDSETDLPLNEFLGLSVEEYSNFVITGKLPKEDAQ